jgi:hypothetical protein
MNCRLITAGTIPNQLVSGSLVEKSLKCAKSAKRVTAVFIEKTGNLDLDIVEKIKIIV